MSRNRIFEKYANEKWLVTRLRFVRVGDIVRWRDDENDQWNLIVITKDPWWNEERNGFDIEYVKYKLTEDFKFDDDMTHVVVKPKKE